MRFTKNAQWFSALGFRQKPAIWKGLPERCRQDVSFRTRQMELDETAAQRRCDSLVIIHNRELSVEENEAGDSPMVKSSQVFTTGDSTPIDLTTGQSHNHSELFSDRNRVDQVAERETLTHGKEAPRQESVANRLAAANARLGRLELAKALRSACVLLLAAALAFSLSGCKDSAAITELVHDQMSDFVDYDNEAKVYEAATGEMLERMESRVLNESETQALEEQQSQAEYNQNPTNPDATTENHESANTNNSSSDASDGTTAGGADVSNAAPSGTANAGGNATGGMVGGNTRQGGFTVSEGNSPEGEADERGRSGSGEGEGGSIWTPDGPTDELPEDVSTIAATQQYALIVQMLAGGGYDESGVYHTSALAAADSDFLTGKAAGVYASEGIVDVVEAWSGDGSASSQCDLDVLLNLAQRGKLSCVLVCTDDFSTLSQEQADALYEAGVDVVVMPSMRTDEGITASVQIVGRLLSNANTRYDAAAMADRYVELHDWALDDARESNGGYPRIPVTTTGSVWDTGSYGDMATTEYCSLLKRDAAGAALGASSWTSLPDSEFDGAARVFTAYIEGWGYTDAQSHSIIPSTVGDYHAMYSSDLETNGVGVTQSQVGTSPYSYYLQCGGVVNARYTNELVRRGYVMMAVSGLHLPSSAQYWGDFSDAVSHEAQGGYWTSPSLSAALPTGNSYWLPGTDYYPALIAKNATIANRIRVSSQTEYGAYNTGNSYDVFVMPSGVLGSWGDGVEGYLLTPWAYSMFHGGNALQANGHVEDFYKTFMRANYGTVVSDYQTVVECG